MLTDFKKQAARPPEAGTFLTSLGVPFTRDEKGITVPGDLDLKDRGLERLPDLSEVTVEGDFICSGNKLASLTGAPRRVGKNFNCANNLLVSLEGGPEEVGLNYHCGENPQLRTLRGIAETIGGGINCSQNRKLKMVDVFPERFTSIVSDYGIFTDGFQVLHHQNIRIVQVAKEREAAILAATVLQKPMRASKPFALRVKV